MIDPIIIPEVFHSDTSHTINMGEMDAESIAFMLSQSRNGFYSNKELAPIREYATNARDSHIQSGCPFRPIEVTFPSQMAPELRIRDFGNGLTEQELERVYFKYWKSTKRNTNDQNGFYGIGSKSAMAYCDVYTIISICDGKKMVYTAHIDGKAQRIFNGKSTEGEESGIEVIIPIQQKDIAKFHYEALNFFKYWDILPIFHNIDKEKLTEAFAPMDVKPFISGDEWSVRPSGYGKGNTKAIMGFVAYDVDWDQVKHGLEPTIAHKIEGIFTFLEENLTTLYFPNGTLSFTPNRESLQYNDATTKALGDKLVSIYNNLLKIISSEISDAPNIWEAKIRYNQIFRKELDSFNQSNAYSGNLNTLELILKGRIEWNGIRIAGGSFEKVSDWDKNKGNITEYHRDDTYESILDVYVKDDDKISVKSLKFSGGRRRYRRYGYENGKIVCSPHSVVVIQDTDKESLAKGLARWFHYKSPKEVIKVYVLDLSNPTVKADFIKAYDFGTVPVVYVSQNIPLIKAYLSSIRAPRTPSGPREIRPIVCPFVEIQNRRSSNGHVSLPIWNYREDNIRVIDGGFYVVHSKDSFEFNGRSICHSESQYFWQSVYDLAKLAGKDVSRVYGITQKSADAEWFKEAVEDGKWVNIANWIDENIGILPKDIIKKISAYLTVITNRIGIVAIKKLIPLIVDADGLIGKFCREVDDIYQNWEIRGIPSQFYQKGWEADDVDVERFRKMNDTIQAKYPLIFKINDGFAVGCVNKNDTYQFNVEVTKSVAEYINLVDAHA